MKLYRSMATVGGLTLVSRIMGFFRDIAFAALLGAGPVAEAFVVAFRFPNLFRRWFGEGAFNSAFVPLFTKRLAGEGPEAARKFASEALSGLAYILTLLSIIAIGAMPFLMYVLAPGFSADGQKFDLAVAMSRIAFPYLLCMSLVALLSGVLNALGKFVESSLVSVVLNIVLMAAMALAWGLGYGNDPRTGYVLAWGIFAAGIAQLALLIIGAKRNAMLPRLQWPRMSPDMRNLLALGIPGAIAGGATQLNIVIGGMIASLHPGAVSHLFYADRLYELPLAMVGIAIGVVLLPDITRHLRLGDQKAVMDSQNRALEVAMLLTVPAAVALAIIPTEIVSTLYERGAFRAADTASVAAVLIFFALGLPAFVMIKVFSPAFFAREKTKTTMRFATASIAVNTIGSIALFFLFRELGYRPHIGIAIATSVGGWLNALLLWRRLSRDGLFVLDARAKRALIGTLLASAVMGAALYVAAPLLAPWLAASNGVWLRMAALALLVTCGAVVYVAAAFVTGGLRFGALKSAFSRRGRP